VQRVVGARGAYPGVAGGLGPSGVDVLDDDRRLLPARLSGAVAQQLVDDAEG
jgi:hypothetical protein